MTRLKYIYYRYFNLQRQSFMFHLFTSIYFIFRDTDTSKNTWSVLKALNLADVATEEDVAIVRETCAVVSERGAKIVAAGKLKGIAILHVFSLF